jgi:hypothetical protein
MLEPQSAEELTWQDVLRVGALLGSQAAGSGGVGVRSGHSDGRG